MSLNHTCVPHTCKHTYTRAWITYMYIHMRMETHTHTQGHIISLHHPTPVDPLNPHTQLTGSHHPSLLPLLSPGQKSSRHTLHISPSFQRAQSHNCYFPSPRQCDSARLQPCDALSCRTDLECHVSPSLTNTFVSCLLEARTSVRKRTGSQRALPSGLHIVVRRK